MPRELHAAVLADHAKRQAGLTAELHLRVPLPLEWQGEDLTGELPECDFTFYLFFLGQVFKALKL